MNTDTRAKVVTPDGDILTDLGYTDDISLISDRVEQAQQFLTRVETECATVGLRLKAKKTEVITNNILQDL
ncbi:unnamed protein product [Lota lota]